MTDIPCWYYGVAFAVSAYQACRGFVFQWLTSKDRNYANKPPELKFTVLQRVILLCLADTFTYFVLAFSGFVALFFAWQFISADSPPSPVTFIFLFLYGVFGITAKLPDMLHSGSIKFPWLGG